MRNPGICVGIYIKTVLSFALISPFFFLPTPVPADTILIEAEHFDNYGGWVLDQQFMDQMGSPFLLAHGLGIPVDDAVTTVTFPSTGIYYVWVRTRDWVCPWKSPDTPPSKRAEGFPGVFQLKLNGEIIPATFGNEGAEWHWQQGPEVNITDAQVNLALHDLTGFEGRCDAIVFTTDTNWAGPNVDPEMKTWRRTTLGISENPEDAGDFNFVVIGGGMAGTCAAVKSARQGVHVALVQDRPVLGGNNSSEVRVPLGGGICYPPYIGIGNIVRELDSIYGSARGPAEAYQDANKMAVVTAEPNIGLFLNCRVNQVEMDGNTIVAVIGENIKTGQLLRFRGQRFADCTGDGVIGHLAGADSEMQTTGHMGMSNLWRVADMGTDTNFPSCPWALNLYNSPIPTYNLGDWFWESGFNHDPIGEDEYIRDWNFRAMYGAWDKLKNHTPGYGTCALEWAAYIAGKRESRRLMGDIVLTIQDFLQSIAYPDGSVPTVTYADFHVPDPYYQWGFEGDAFISTAIYTPYPIPYWIPYRCLYSRNINNLFMAGRNISVTGEALSAVRLMRVGGMMGEVVGLAASICKKYDVNCRDVYEYHLEELQELMAEDYYEEPNNTGLGPNLALSAEVNVSSSYGNGTQYPKTNINDGSANYKNNTQRWLSSGYYSPDYIEFEWNEPQRVSLLRIVSGWYNGYTVLSVIDNFKLQYYDNNSWSDIEGSQVIENTSYDRTKSFPIIQASKIRLVISRTPDNISRIWEVQLFQPQYIPPSPDVVDFQDFEKLAHSWLLADPEVDLTNDGVVDANDLEVLAGNWLQQVTLWPD